MTRAAWLVAVAAACSQAVPTASAPVRLDAARPSQQLELPKHDGRVILEVVPLQADPGEPVTIAVMTPDNAEPIARVSLYPVDRPGRFALRIPRKASRVTVAIDRGTSEGAVVEVRAVPIQR